MSQEQIAIIAEKQAPIKFSFTIAAIKKAAKQWKDVPDVSTKEGYSMAQQAKRELTPMRTAITKEMNLQKVSAQEHIKSINKKGNGLITMIESIEKPIYDAKKTQDELVAKQKREKELAEQNRIDDIQALITEIRELTMGLLGEPVEVIEERLRQANEVKVTDTEYMEYVESASTELGLVKEQLAAAVDQAREIAEQKAEVDRKQKILDVAAAEQQVEIDRKQKVQDDAAAAQKVVDDERQAKMDAQQAKMDQQQKEFDDRQAEALRSEEEKTERERIQTEEAAANLKRIADEKKNAKALKDRRPEDLKLQDYADALMAVPAPDISDLMLCAIYREVAISITDISILIYDKTQK